MRASILWAELPGVVQPLFKPRSHIRPSGRDVWGAAMCFWGFRLFKFALQRTLSWACRFCIGVGNLVLQIKVLGICRMTEALFVQEHPPKKRQGSPQPNFTPPPFAKRGFVNFPRHGRGGRSPPGVQGPRSRLGPLRAGPERAGSEPHYYRGRILLFI